MMAPLLLSLLGFRDGTPPLASCEEARTQTHTTMGCADNEVLIHATAGGASGQVQCVWESGTRTARTPLLHTPYT